MIKQLLQQLFVLLAVVTSMGTLVHDTKFDRAFQLSVPLSTISTNLTSHLDSLNDAAAHTHVEHTSVSQIFGGIPRIQAKDDHRKYNLSRYLTRGSDAFGGSRILWPSV
jgi:hypothetical protein